MKCQRSEAFTNNLVFVGLIVEWYFLCSEGGIYSIFAWSSVCVWWFFFPEQYRLLYWVLAAMRWYANSAAFVLRDCCFCDCTRSLGQWFENNKYMIFRCFPVFCFLFYTSSNRKKYRSELKNKILNEIILDHFEIHLVSLRNMYRHHEFAIVTFNFFDNFCNFFWFTAWLASCAYLNLM